MPSQKKVMFGITCPNQIPVLFVDCQTTGPSPATAHLLEIAWLIDVPGQDLLQKSFLVRQPEGASLSRRIEMLTGISQADIDARAQAVEVVAERFFADVDSVIRAGGLAVAHYSRFEKVFLDRLGQINNSSFGSTQAPQNSLRLICTHNLAKKFYPHLPSHSLRAVAGFFGNTLVDHKRAASHVLATRVVWQACIQSHVESGKDLNSLLEIHDQKIQLGEKPKTRPKDLLRISDVKRLTLPLGPGVYRFYGKNGALLYVGKATSLKSRVNSYFRKAKGGDPRKREMLMQAWDVQFTEVTCPLEAALLEYRTIQQELPPYNLALRRKPSELKFLDSMLREVSQDASGAFGPFSEITLQNNLYALRGVGEFISARMNSVGTSDAGDRDSFVEGFPVLARVFHDLNDSAILDQGIEIWAQQWGIQTQQIENEMRRILGFGVGLLPAYLADLESQADPPAEDEEGGDPEETEFVWTVELVAAKLNSIMRRSSVAWLESQWLRRLKGARVSFVDHGVHGAFQLPIEWDPVALAELRIYAQEVRRILAANESVTVLLNTGQILTESKLKRLLALGL